MQWVPPWLGRLYAELYLRFQGEQFTTKEALPLLKMSQVRANLALSRLTSYGWLMRLSRGRYMTIEPSAIFSDFGSAWVDKVKGNSGFPIIQRAFAELSQLYGRSVVSVALFGSFARSGGTPTSDVDILAIVERLPDDYSSRIRQVQPVQAACSKMRELQWKRDRHYHLLDIVLVRPEELQDNSLFLLDFTQDAIILYDRDGFFEKFLDRLRRRLVEMGAVRMETASGSKYWNLRQTQVKL